MPALPDRTVTCLEITARTDIDALAATFTRIQRKREVVSRPRIFNGGEAAAIAVHEALLTIKALAAGHAAGRLFTGLLVANRLINLQLRVTQPFLLRATGTRSTLLVAIVVGLDRVCTNCIALRHFTRVRFTAKSGVCRFGSETSLGNSLAGNPRSAIIAAGPDIVLELAVLFGMQPLVAVLQ